MEVSGEQDEVDWVVLGMGLNVNTEFSELPVALRRTATSLKIAGGETRGPQRRPGDAAAGPRDALPGRARAAASTRP